MASHWGPPGPKSVGEFQISATPYLTSSLLSAQETRHISWDRVTSFIVVRNAVTGTQSSRLAVGFTQNGVQANPAASSNYITLGDGESLSVNIRTTDLYLSATQTQDNDLLDFEVLAGLTDIPRSQFLNLTGSDGYRAIG